MPYMGYWTLVDGPSVKKNSVLELAIFELQHCMSKLFPNTLARPTSSTAAKKTPKWGE